MRCSKDDLTPPSSYHRVQIGSALATVVLTLSNGVYTFSSAPCTIVSPSTGVRCTAPPGVGMGHAVTLTVDGVTSDPLPNRTLAYAAPSLTTIVASVGADGQGADGVGTEGGTTIVITGLVSCVYVAAISIACTPVTLRFGMRGCAFMCAFHAVNVSSVRHRTLGLLG